MINSKTPILKNLTNLLSFLFLTIFLLIIGSFFSCQKSEEIPQLNTEMLQGSGFGLGAITFFVNNIDSAHSHFSQKLGFNLMPQGFFTNSVIDSTESRIVQFPDLSALEVVAIDKSHFSFSNNKYIHEFLEKGEGVRLYSLSSSSLSQTKEWLSDQGFTTDTIVSKKFNAGPPDEGGWDKNHIGFSVLSFDHLNPPADLPRFEEISGFEYRRMQDDWKMPLGMGRSFFRHPNGVVGTAGLEIIVENLDSTRTALKQMGLVETDFIPLDQEALFDIKNNQFLKLKGPLPEDENRIKFLEKRGEGVSSIHFIVENQDSTAAFLKRNIPSNGIYRDTSSGHLVVDSEYGVGVELKFMQEDEDIGSWAKKLKIGPPLDSSSRAYAAELYDKYCALCHGKNREGYAADYAPSLRSESLLATSYNNNFLRYTIQYGRANTAMAGYLLDQGGPLSFVEIELLMQWLNESRGINSPIELSREPVMGDKVMGAKLYDQHCAACHGSEGEGVSGPALGNPMLLATASDEFLKYAILEGRDNTIMPSFKDSLNSREINDVTAFLRSKASGWNIPQLDSIKEPTPEEYILNPSNKKATFTLKEGKYVSAEQLNKALGDSLRLVILDARSKVAWRQTHIPGSIPVPYYEDPEEFLQHIPNDDTWIIAYCACPHAASGQVVRKLNEKGYHKTAILDEGILVWAQMGFAVTSSH